VVIVSSDKDFAQLVRPHVRMFDSMKDVYYDEQKVVEKWGVKPNQFLDYLALRGDASDNIPGVRGIGEKTAQKLLAEHGTLDRIYANVDAIKGALRDKLVSGKDDAYLSKRLVTIVQDLALPLSLDDMKLRPVQREALAALLEKLEIRSLRKKLLDNGGSTSLAEPAPAGSGSRLAFATSAGDISAAPVAPAIETAQRVTGGAIADWSIDDFAHLEPYAEITVFDSERGLYFRTPGGLVRYAGDAAALGPLLSGKKVAWKGFDLKTTWRSLNVIDPLPRWDHMLASYVVRSHEIDSLDQVAREVLGDGLGDLPEVATVFQVLDRLETAQLAKLKSQSVLRVFEEIEMPSSVVLCAMERRGLLLDVAELKAQSEELAVDIRAVEKRIFELAGETFNIASPKQLGQILFVKLKLPSEKRTKTGFSTDSDVLEKLAQEHPICRQVIEYRELTKLKSTYVDALPELVDRRSGRVHTTFKQALTATGRLSSQNPNLQNIPIRTERGRRIRRAFLAPEGHVLVSADYSQIELRVLAHITGDPGLISAFTADLDVHAATASEIFNVSLTDVTPELRRRAKAVNFGIAYGQGAYGLAENLGIGRSEAKEIIDRYFKKFPGVREYMESVVRQAKEQGYVESVFGRRREMWELKSPKVQVQKFGERAAINAPIQSTASDLMKLAMVRIYGECSVPILLQVHDELLFEAPLGEAEEQARVVKKIMESVVELKVPLKVNVAWGKNWFEAHG
jgi:DNA polymerase-1